MAQSLALLVACLLWPVAQCVRSAGGSGSLQMATESVMGTDLEGLLNEFQAMGTEGATIDRFLSAAQHTDELLKGLSQLHNSHGELSWKESGMALAAIGARSCKGIYPFKIARDVLRENLDKGLKAAKGLQGSASSKTLKKSGEDGEDAVYWIGNIWKFLFRIGSIMFESESASLQSAGSQAAGEVFEKVPIFKKGLKLGLKCAPSKEVFYSKLANGDASVAPQAVIQQLLDTASASRVFMDQFPYWGF